MLNPPFEVGPIKWIYLREKCRNFLFRANNFFANFEFIFAIKDSQSTRRGLEYTLNMAQNRGLFVYFYIENPKVYLL